MNTILNAYLQYEGAIKKYLQRYFSRQQDIDDIAHEAFIKAYATEIRTAVINPKRLLFKAAKHAALNEIAKKANTTTDYIEDFNDTPVICDERQLNAEELLDARRKFTAFSMAVADLPPACQKVFVLRKVHGLPAKQVAEKLNISVSAVEKHVATGILKCARSLRAKGYSPAEFGAVAYMAKSGHLLDPAKKHGSKLT